MFSTKSKASEKRFLGSQFHNAHNLVKDCYGNYLNLIKY